MNLKNNHLLKTLLKWTNKKCKYLNIYKNKKNNEKIKKNTWRYHYFISVYQQSSWYHLQFLRYRVWQTEIGNNESFLALLPSPSSPLLKTKKIRIFEKWKKWLEISSFYTSVAKTTIIWGTVPEIRSETDRSFCHFGPFFCHLTHLKTWKIKIRKKTKKASGDLIIYTHMYQKSQSYDVCFLRYEIQHIIFGHFVPFFALLPHYWPQK